MNKIYPTLDSKVRGKLGVARFIFFLKYKVKNIIIIYIEIVKILHLMKKPKGYIYLYFLKIIYSLVFLYKKMII